MARLSSAEVFPPTSFPKYTYVQREHFHHERLLQQWMQSSTQIASISGPSKAGKTVLVQRVIGEDNLYTVSGGSVRAPAASPSNAALIRSSPRRWLVMKSWFPILEAKLAKRPQSSLSLRLRKK